MSGPEIVLQHPVEIGECSMNLTALLVISTPKMARAAIFNTETTHDYSQPSH